MRTTRKVLAVSLFSAASALSAADTSEPGTKEAIAAATTETRFLSPWVADLPASATVPSPTRFLGHIVGAAGELTRTEKIYAYYRALDAASPRVKVETIGKTEEGRDILLVAVGEEAAIEALDATRADMSALADPRRTDEAAMEKIAASARPFYWLQGGLHSTETGSPEMLMELAYRLAVSDDPRIRGIRQKLVVLINPVAEPDGRDRAVDWFYKHLKGKTDFDELPPIDPPYWGKYVYHDNNRDLVQRKLALTRASEDAFLKWHPIVFHDLHESIPLLSIWTGTGPYNTELDPITTSEWHSIAFYEVSQLTALGLPGVWTWGFGEGFSQIYADSVATVHNAIGRGYETFGNGTAETVERVIEPSYEITGRPVTEADWYRPVPPPKKFRWSMRDNTNYMQSGVLAALDYTARNSDNMMRNFWRRGRNSVRRGETEKPYAIAVPEEQKDRGRLIAMIDLLRAHGIEVGRAKAAFKVAEGSFPAGTFLVRMDQPYRGYALDLLVAQKYPADKAPYPPYDDVAWSLPQTFGVEVKAIEDAAVRQVAADPVTAPVRLPGRVDGSGPVYLLSDTGQDALLEARVRLASFRVDAAEKAFSSGGREFPAGSWILEAQPGLGAELTKIAADLSLDVSSAPRTPGIPKHAIEVPRLAVLQTWNDTQSAGWVRMIFDERKIPYTLLMDEDVRRGGLSERFDVILFPNTGDSLKGIVNGMDPRFSPLSYVKSPEFPTLGSPTSSEDITGGLTWKGVGNLEEFVRGGGLFVTLGGASTLALDGGIVRGVSRAGGKASTPGSELTARFRRPDHPIAYGYPETTSVFREDNTVYRVQRPREGWIVLQWGARIPKDDDTPADTKKGKPKAEEEPPLVVSGGVKGGDDLVGKPAILDVPVGKGRVVAFDFDPIHRYMTRSDFRLVWNALLNWNDLPPTPVRAGAPPAR
ncbi:MAG TPA: M14 family zinc carboxypeptidase [Thermoanaerobaculia bacterium]